MADTTVTIDVRNCAASQAPGFTDAVLFGGPAIHSYCYQFAGGSGGSPGDVTEKKDGNKKTIDINMIADSAYYRLTAVLIGNDPQNQLSVKSLRGNSATIEDKNDQLETNAYYCVVLEDISAGANGVLIACDPRISNVP
ncbi:MAG: hypothetical protein MUE63_11950 [Xanthomonadales bacterium]|jgi:hypothetical protein|nr:hypothetical protein [Xanthomonadales bacterium]